ncbi:hypothetical protein ABVK25_008314 [Lepraria finkii]|uniref:Uncharacterized protein n=1 Tax=Lepraria finkii TaxID=1340010 RepID=A0ABR4B0L7_9LECA
MQYVRSIGGSVSKTWNSINPATLSGAIDVIVVEQEDGSLACSPFHVRFGKFSLLRPYEKKVEFKVNNVKQNHAMKLGEGGEAFFVFETSDDIPESLQTSPVISPAASPQSLLQQDAASPRTLQEPEYLDLNTNVRNDHRRVSPSQARPMMSDASRAESDFGALTPLSTSPGTDEGTLGAGASSNPNTRSIPQIKRSASEELLPISTHPQADMFSSPSQIQTHEKQAEFPGLSTSPPTERSQSPPPLSPNDAVNRARSLSKKLSMSNIPTRVTDSGDLMLDMTGYKSSEDEALRAEVIARKILAEELEGNYDIGALIGADEQGTFGSTAARRLKKPPAARLDFEDLRPEQLLVVLHQIQGTKAMKKGYRQALRLQAGIRGHNQRRPPD